MKGINDKALNQIVKDIECLIVDFEDLKTHIEDLLQAIYSNYSVDEVETLYNEMVECAKTFNLEHKLIDWILGYLIGDN